MLSYYPPVNPYRTHSLSVEEPHNLYIEEVGNPDGLPVVFLHGGPGLGISAQARRFFDPEVYRIILFDQRGCGQSKPHAAIAKNSTQDLVADLEKIRKYLAIEKWVLFGGSWGSTLSLVYAQAHPEAVLGLILRGIFLGRTEDVQWLYGGGGAAQVFSDQWTNFLKVIPPEQRVNLLSAYHSLLNGPDEIAQMIAAKAWATWEAYCATLQPNQQFLKELGDSHATLSVARIENHYFMNHCFLEENQIIENMEKIKDKPGIIVHGRYDMVCKFENAWTLHNHWPGSELNIIRDAGHASCEPGITSALIRATQAMAHRLI